MRGAAGLLVVVAAFSAQAVTVLRPCASSPAFSIERKENGHTLLTLTNSRQEFDIWQPPVAVVSGTRVAVNEEVVINDVAGRPSCEFQTADLGVLPDGAYDVAWTLTEFGFTPTGKLPPVHYATAFTVGSAPPGCAAGTLTATVRTINQSVQIDVHELTRAATYDPPSVARNGSHFTIEQTQHVNSAAIIETGPAFYCHTSTFVLGSLPQGDYDAAISEAIDDPASPRTISTSVSFHVDPDKGRGRGVRH